MGEFRKVITKPGEIIDFETVFEENPYLRTGVPSKKGTVERIDYSTSVYENGKTYNKTCYVYLPYGYDADDTSKKYNVLYFQHGNTCEPAMFAIGGNKYMFDMLFESGEIEPCILVFITYYMDPLGESRQRIENGMIEAGDGGWPGLPPYYYKEVVNDIIPAVETKFNTYLAGTTLEDIKASRDHRGFCGYSRGSVMTWRMLHYSFEYFRYFAPMSCHTMGNHKMGEKITEEEVIEFVTAGIKANPELPFFIFASNGGKEDVAPMKEQMKYITKQDCFSYGNDPKKNNIYFAVSDFYHTDYLVPYYLWNSLKVLFR